MSEERFFAPYETAVDRNGGESVTLSRLRRAARREGVILGETLLMLTKALEIADEWEFETLVVARDDSHARRMWRIVGQDAKRFRIITYDSYKGHERDYKKTALVFVDHAVEETNE